MTGIQWTERFSGLLAPASAANFSVPLLEGEGSEASAWIRVSFDDVERWITDPNHPGVVETGSIECPGLDCSATIDSGTFEIFVPANARLADSVHLRIRYRLEMSHKASGDPLTLHGFKLIENDPGLDSWSDVTTLFTRIVRPGNAGAELLFAIGVLHITVPGFVRELVSFRGTDGSLLPRASAVLQYQSRFVRRLARAYVGAPITQTRPSFPIDQPEPGWQVPDRDRDWHAVPGANQLERKIVPFHVKDLDFPLNVQRLRLTGVERQVGEPVLLIPGAGVRANMFYGQPVGTSLAECLLRCGYDVWVENWRASIDFPPNSYTLDRAARIDHVRAVDVVLENTNKEKLRAFVHCQGSVSFLMAYVAGYLDGKVSHVVSSAVSLFVEVRSSTWLKQRVAVPFVQLATPWMDAQWGLRAGTPAAAVFAAVATRLERPCRNQACQVASFMWGSGWDTLLLHIDGAGEAWLDPEVHEWSARELGYTPMSFIDQICESSRYGHVVPAEPRDPETPASYMSIYRAPKPRDQNPRFTFIAGDENRMFRWQGQARAAEFMRDYHNCPADFVGLPGFGHLDSIWGRRAPDVIFPVVRDALEWDGGPNAPSVVAENRQEDRGLKTEWPARDGRVTRAVRALRWHRH